MSILLVVHGHVCMCALASAVFARVCRRRPRCCAGRMALGPRYIEFHPNLPVAYVVNELSSEASPCHRNISEEQRTLAQGSCRRELCMAQRARRHGHVQDESAHVRAPCALTAAAPARGAEQVGQDSWRC